MSIESLLRIETALPEVSAEAAYGVTVGTMILTTEGALPVQFLAPGDRIITRSGAKLLKDVEVSVVTNDQMIRVCASALGHTRPENDCFLAPGQKVLLRDWRAKALYGKDVAAVEVRRLADGEYIRPETVSEIRLFSLIFERDEVIYADGMELLCEAKASRSLAPNV